MVFLHTRAKGDTGENIACKYLINKGFEIISRNYLKPWGELDIIAVRDNILHFVEVKSVTVDFRNHVDSHRPEENVHNLKASHIRRTIQTYLAENREGSETEFQFHVICVYMDFLKRTAKVRMLNNIIV